MKKIAYAVSALILAFSIASCGDKNDNAASIDFYKAIGGTEKTGRDWKLANMYFLPGVSSYDQTVENGTDIAPQFPDWVRDNYYTFYNTGYGISYEKGVTNPQLNLETAESWNDTLRAYKYIQFTFTGGKTVHITNRIQKPAFNDDWEIKVVGDQKLILYQQDRASNQEFVMVFERH